MQDVELTLIGYNTPTTDSLSDEASMLRLFHNHLTVQAGAYQNSTWVVGVAKAGVEDGHALMGGSCIIAPSGEIFAETATLEDELVVADSDFDQCVCFKENIFNFASHRRPEAYGFIVESAGRVGTRDVKPISDRAAGSGRKGGKEQQRKPRIGAIAAVARGRET